MGRQREREGRCIHSAIITVSEVRYQMSEVRCQMSDVRCQMSGIRGQESGIRKTLSHAKARRKAFFSPRAPRLRVKSAIEAFLKNCETL
ncbi:MAG: hypothetical protein FWC38_01760 [Proteobacteria bacterium]|nr:hypothetical protein [Pseudomonadota bacterium]